MADGRCAMTKIEQINWARQILSQTPTVPERDDETVKYLTEANLKLREALEAMTSCRDEATERAHRHLATATNWRHKATELTAKLGAAGRVNAGLVKQIDELKAELDRGNVWYNVAKTTESENKILTDRIEHFDALLGARRQQVERLRERLQRGDVEIKRLKQRVNELIRAKKVAV